MWILYPVAFFFGMLFGGGIIGEHDRQKERAGVETVKPAVRPVPPPYEEENTFPNIRPGKP